MGCLRAISGPVWEVVLEGQSEGHSEVNLVNSGPILGNLIELLKKAFIWPWVGSYL